MRVIDTSHSDSAFHLTKHSDIFSNEGNIPESLEIVAFLKSKLFNQKFRVVLAKKFPKKFLYLAKLSSFPEILENACAVPFVTGSIQKFKPESPHLMEGVHIFIHTNGTLL